MLPFSFMSDIWLVQLPAGERKMTLDELDAAYQAERIDDRTLVREPGTPWRTLGSLLGIETHPSVRPVSIDLETELPQSKARRNVIILGMPAAALVACGALLAVTKLGAATPPPLPAAAAVVVAPTVTAPISPISPPVVDKLALTGAQKQALAKADQDREKKLQKSKETKKKPVPAPKAKPVFTKSGNKYDPLNAKL